VVVLVGYFKQFDYVFAARLFKFAEFRESCDLATKEILGDIIVDIFEVDGFDGYFSGRVGQLVAEVYVTSCTSAEEMGVDDGKTWTDGSGGG
jgi:hypothetical protein